MRTRLTSPLLLTLLLAAPAHAQGARQNGDALRTKLRSEGPLKRLIGQYRYAVRVGASRPVGSAVLRTDIVERDGQLIYRIKDTLELTLPNLGSVNMSVDADLRGDFSPLRITLRSEEPRGRGTVSTVRVELVREAGEWVRYVYRGTGADRTHEVLEDLPADILVLTPPLGAGERLSRLVPPNLGQRYSARALDLETGGSAAWKVSLDDRVTLELEQGGQKTSKPGVRLTRSESGAKLTVLRRIETASPSLRVHLSPRRDPKHENVLLPRRLDLRVGALITARADPTGPIGTVRALLAAVARGDRAAVTGALDLKALYRAAQGDPKDADLRRAFEQVLLDRLSNPEWLRARGLALPAAASTSADFTLERDGSRARVSPRRAPRRVFRLQQRQGRWVIVDLPR